MNDKQPLRVLIQGFFEFLEGCEEDELLFHSRGPLLVALCGGDRFKIGDLVVPIPSITERQLNALPAAYTYREGGETLHARGRAIRLPDYLAHLQNAWTTFLKPDYASGKVRYNYKAFLKQYREGLGKEAESILHQYAKGSPKYGVQGQIDTDARLLPGQRGMHPRDMASYLRLLFELDPDLRARNFWGEKLIHDLHGLQMWDMRYPAAGFHASDLTTLLELPDRAPGHIYFNPIEVEEDKQGDSDGDGGYGYQEGKPEFKEIERVGEFPRFTITDNQYDPEALIKESVALTLDEMLDKVMGACIKELTGLLTYTCLCLARCHAQTTKDKAHFRAAYIREAVIYVPLIEEVMDSWKPKKGKEAKESLRQLENLADQLHAFVAGAAPELNEFVGAFKPFLSTKVYQVLHRQVSITGTSLEFLRTTAAGTMIAAGRGLDKVVLELVEKLLAHSVSVKDLLTTLIEDGHGDRIFEFFLEDEEEGGGGGGSIIPNFQGACDPNVVGTALSGLTVWDKLLFPLGVVSTENQDKSITLTGVLHPWWMFKDDATTCAYTWKITLHVPYTTEFVGSEHRSVHLGGLQPMRMFRPRFVDEDGLKVQGWTKYVQLSLIEALRDVCRRYSVKVRKAKAAPDVEKALQKRLDKWVRALPAVDANSSLVQRFVYEVVVEDRGHIVHTWRARRRLLEMICKSGNFNPLYGSKDAPGQLVCKAGPGGVPSFARAFDPLAHLGPQAPKRQSEYLGLGEALVLRYPTELPLRTPMVTLPVEQAKRVRRLRVLMADIEGVNVFTHNGKQYCHYTHATFQSCLRKMEVAEQRRRFQVKEDADEFVSRVRGNRVKDIEIVPSVRDLGEGLVSQEWEVIIRNPGPDAGKQKSHPTVKGVKSVIPGQAYYVERDNVRRLDEDHEIDVIIPLPRKGETNTVLTLMLTAAGIHEVDPNATPEELLAQAQAVFGDKNPLCLSPVLIDRGGDRVEGLGYGLVGELPFYTPPQTSYSLFNVRRDIRVELHTLIMHSLSADVPKEVQARFAQIIQAIKEVNRCLSFYKKQEGE